VSPLQPEAGYWIVVEFAAPTRNSEPVADEATRESSSGVRREINRVDWISSREFAKGIE
jgi:hypothetical protein